MSEGEIKEKDNMVGIKLFIMFCVFLAGLNVFFPYLPCLKGKQGEGGQKKKACCAGKFFSFTNAFAAGMLLTMSMVHIMPESVEMYKKYLETTLDEKVSMYTELSSNLEGEDHDDDHKDEEGEHADEDDHGDEEDDHHEEEDHKDEDHEDEDHEEEGHEEEGHEEEGHDDHEEDGHEEEGHNEEGHEGEEEHEGHDDHEGEEMHVFPLPYVFFVVGFLFMLTIDQVVFKDSEPKKPKKPTTNPPNPTASVDNDGGNIEL